MLFAAALNMHFLDNQHPFVSVRMLFNMLSRHPSTFSQKSAMSEMPLNVARTPTSWLSKQDEYIGMELIRAAQNMRAVMPNAVRVIAKAYSPLFFELSGSDRAEAPDKRPNIISTIDLDILMDHMFPFAVVLVVVVVSVTMLMNHFLSKHVPEDIPETRSEEVPLLKCQTLIEGHSLDVAVLASSPRGILVSVGLDRRIVVWKLRGNNQPVLKDMIRPTCAEHVLWPVMAVAVDPKGEWLAIAPRSGMISFYEVEKSTLHHPIGVELQGRQPSAFFFAPPSLHNHDKDHGPRLVIVRSDGCLFEVYVRTKEIVRHQIYPNILVVSSHGVFTPRLPLRIVTACQRGRIFTTKPLIGGGWRTDQLDLMSPPSIAPVMEPGESCTILPLSSLGMVISSRSCNVELVDLVSGKLDSKSIFLLILTGQRRYH